MSSVAEVIYKLGRSVVVELPGDQEITVKYDPSRYDRELVASVNKVEIAGNRTEATYQLLSSLLTGWNLDDEYNVEILDTLGYFVHSAILTALTEDFKLLHGSKKNLDDGSSNPA